LSAQILCWTLALAVGPRSSVAGPAPRVHALIIGNNQPRPELSEAAGRGPALDSLQFADDDAAAFFDLISGVSPDAHLLTIMDRDTQALYPRLAAVARPSTVNELHAAVTAIAAEIEGDRRAGRRSTLFVFFSGHGAMIDGQSTALALLDGGITQQLLYDEILEPLRADTVHLLVDACHAESVVRPRDTRAETVTVAASDAQALLVRSTLARFPHVGAIVAAAGNAQSHEWDVLRHGVFTHELLSGLRGAADVNGDAKIEYSELYAFLGAANRKVADARARLAVVARPPDVDRRTVLWDLNWASGDRVVRLTRVPGRAGLVRIEDDAGRLLASFHGEPGFEADLLLPANEGLYIRASEGEARLAPTPGGRIDFDGLSFGRPTVRARGSLADALRRGLFASEFGPSYYNGFVDQAADFVPVTFPAPAPVLAADSPASTTIAVDAGAAPRASERQQRLPPMRLLAGVGVSTTVARELDSAVGIRLGARPASPGGGVVASLDLLRASRGGLAESRFVASGGWVWMMRKRSFSGWAGAVVGAGAIAQNVADEATRWSGLLMAAPTVGGSLDLSSRLGAWIEGEVLALGLRRDGSSVSMLAPVAWLGLSLGL
jgi:hypothetical protein